jgi:hypothetical protein
MNQSKINALLESGNWMIRMDDEGLAYGGFKWKTLGIWTYARDWNSEPVCGGGLHGQNHLASGHCSAGKRLVLCETDGEPVVIDGNKLKVAAARIIAINENIPVEFLNGMSLDLRNYAHPLPSGLTSIGGDCDLSNYAHPLPSGLTSIGGSCDLSNYAHPLPSGLTSIGGDCDLRNYAHPLPSGLTSINGEKRKIQEA